jgi:hypothetical protein
MRHAGLAALLVSVALPLAAQETGAPLSAIEWLSQSVSQTGLQPAVVMPPLDEPPTSRDATVPEITVTPLGAPSPDGIGLLSPDLTGLPQDLWAASPEAVLVDLIRAERPLTLPALQDLIVTLMLARADAPLGAGPAGALFLARVDKLLDMGALEPAQALLEAADVGQPEVFRRWFDVSLLTGTEARACARMIATPALAPTLPARIFCLPREGDWAAAAVTLHTARALGQITPEEEALLARYLDPDLFEGEPDLPPPERLSPLVFRMREAIGQYLPAAGLPLAFAHADLRETAAWRNQIEAAERLARAGAISPNVLQAVYTARRPAASGGVWDRAAAIQALEAALAQRGAGLDAALPRAWDAMAVMGTEVAFARIYSPALTALAPEGKTGELAFGIALLSPDYELAALTRVAANNDEAFLQGIARGQLTATVPQEPRSLAVAAAFAPGAQPPEPMAAAIAENRLGEALLRAIAAFQQGLDGDARAVTEALVTLRAVGMEDVARRAALQYLILQGQE